MSEPSDDAPLDLPPPEPAVAIVPAPLPPIDPNDPSEGGKFCGQRTRQAEAKHQFCHRPSGWGTEHPGFGSCKLHGGASFRYGGRYALLLRPRVKELITQFQNDPDPLDTLPELAAARAIFVDFLERYDEWREAILAWHTSWSLTRRPVPKELSMAFSAVIDEYEIQCTEGGTDLTDKQTKDLADARKFVAFLRGTDPTPRPHQILDVSAAMQHVDTVTKIVERIEETRAKNAISRKDLIHLMDQMGRVVMRHVEEPATLKKIRAGWMDLAL